MRVNKLSGNITTFTNQPTTILAKQKDNEFIGKTDKIQDLDALNILGNQNKISFCARDYGNNNKEQARQAFEYGVKLKTSINPRLKDCSTEPIEIKGTDEKLFIINKDDSKGTLTMQDSKGNKIEGKFNAYDKVLKSLEIYSYPQDENKKDVYNFRYAEYKPYRIDIGKKEIKPCKYDYNYELKNGIESIDKCFKYNNGEFVEDKYTNGYLKSRHFQINENYALVEDETFDYAGHWIDKERKTEGYDNISYSNQKGYGNKKFEYDLCPESWEINNKNTVLKYLFLFFNKCHKATNVPLSDLKF